MIENEKFSVPAPKSIEEVTPELLKEAGLALEVALKSVGISVSIPEIKPAPLSELSKISNSDYDLFKKSLEMYGREVSIFLKAFDDLELSLAQYKQIGTQLTAFQKLIKKMLFGKELNRVISDHIPDNGPESVNEDRRLDEAFVNALHSESETGKRIDDSLFLVKIID